MLASPTVCHSMVVHRRICVLDVFVNDAGKSSYKRFNCVCALLIASALC